jgi:iron(III) transport system ATP-binding protein
MAIAKPAERPEACHLRIRGLTKRFGAFTALERVDLDVRAGEFLSFLGPSGCGKTTLLRAISGLDVQDEGEVWHEGIEISTLPVGRRNFGIVFQSYALFPNLTARDNVAYGLVSSGRPRAEVVRRVAELVELMGLEDHAGRYPAQLSGGQQQRVALARALALSPGMLLLDEPLSALDARVRARLRGELRSLQRRLGITTIMVTHDQEEALTMSDRIAVMRAGRLEQVGTPTEIYAHPATPFVAEFVGRMNFLAGELREPNVVEVRGHPMALGTAVRLARGAPVTVCVRPEDISLRWQAAPPSTNLIPVTVSSLEFVGSYFSVTLVTRTDLNLHADVPTSDVRDLGLAPGVGIEVHLPPSRLRVFPRVSAADLA